MQVPVNAECGVHSWHYHGFLVLCGGFAKAANRGCMTKGRVEGILVTVTEMLRREHGFVRML